jgi:hypothetical protein
MLTYAAATPESLDPTSRQNYATFLQYAAGAGQTPGVNVGQLPAGYAPLPAALQTETLATANAILNPPSTSTATTPTPTPTTTPPVTPPPPQPATPYVATPVATTVTTTTQVPRTLATATLALNASRQPFFGVGAVRWAFIIVLGTGLAATLGTVLFEIRRRRRMASPPP